LSLARNGPVFALSDIPLVSYLVSFLCEEKKRVTEEQQQKRGLRLPVGHEKKRKQKWSRL
jgi:hypothetical protein